MKSIATINPNNGGIAGDDSGVVTVGSVTSVSFDPTGSYLAYSGVDATKICVVKDWERVICTLVPSKSGIKSGKKKDSEDEGNEGILQGGVVWGGELGVGVAKGDACKVWLATGCDGERPVRFWGIV